MNVFDLRRDLHRIPELSFHETKTQTYVRTHLESLGLAPRVVAHTGLVVDLQFDRSGPTIALRADMDALPIEETTGLPFSSHHPGVHHACGHDGHMAILLAMANWLTLVGAVDPNAEDRKSDTEFEAEAKHDATNAPDPEAKSQSKSKQTRAQSPKLKILSNMKGTVRLIFQPAEEHGDPTIDPEGGARLAIREGILHGVDEIYGLHLWNPLPRGTIGVRPGPLMASSDVFEIHVRGRGGHGAMPRGTKDAVLIGAHVVNALHTIVPRDLNPQMPAVITIGAMHAGTSSNVIASDAYLSGTTRCFDSNIQQFIRTRVTKICAGISTTFGCPIEVTSYFEEDAVLHNDPRCSDAVAKAASRVPGLKVRDPNVQMASEDFSFYLNRVPGCFFLVGSAIEDVSTTPRHHESTFDFNEEALVDGLAVFKQLVLSRMSQPKPPASHN